MARKLLSVEDFRSSAKEGGETPDAMVVCASSGTAEPVANSRRVKFVFSDGSVDRSGDMIDPKGWILDRFQKNPVALFGHDSSNVDSVIGRAVNVGASGGKLVGEIEFAEADVNPKADMAFRMVEAGILSAVSVGFMPLEFAFTTDKNRPYGIDFSKQELLEISLVPVPCNANALIQARSMGIYGPIAEYVERILDGESKVSVPRKLLEETFRVAKTPRSVTQKYLAPEMKEGSEWHVGCSKDLPVEEAEDWDGAAASARMFEAAGFDGDEPDVDQVKRGFLIYDASNPTLKSSYKLPFADIVDGELKAITTGLKAVSNRLSHIDENVRDEAWLVVVGYQNPELNEKAGRKISAANAAMLQKAMDHHQAATDCIKSIMDNPEGLDLEPDTTGSGDPATVHDPVQMSVDPVKVDVDRERRIRHANAIKLAAEIAAS